MIKDHARAFVKLYFPLICQACWKAKENHIWNNERQIQINGDCLRLCIL
uniref:Uncharacterized protein n=1 Tax=Anguilla anguilla TaxID=7936 RepID=A0A0E9U0N6_ANGAN